MGEAEEDERREGAEDNAGGVRVERQVRPVTWHLGEQEKPRR